MKRKQLILKMRDLLLRRRQELRRTLSAELALLGHDHELRPVGDCCDDAQGSAEAEVFSQLAQAENRELRAVENALQRMREGKYGLCEACSGKILPARLQALPYATLCVSCQHEAETGRKFGTLMTDWTGAGEGTEDEDWTAGNLDVAVG